MTQNGLPWRPFLLSEPARFRYLPVMHITPRIHIEDEDLQFEFIRASGPGGQNVNKVATAVRLRVRVDAIHGLDEDALVRLAALAGKRITVDGELIIRAEAQRTQDANRKAALERLALLISQAAIRPKPRRATKPTRASKERRLASKAKQSRLKTLRKGTDD